MTTAPLLTLEHIDKDFGAGPVLRDVGLTLDESEILFLLGPSGCGKTTLLRIIAGFERADGGRMRIRDRAIFGAGAFVPPQGRNLGYVPQEGVLFPHLNVYRNIAYGLGNGRGKTAEERRRVHELMEMTNITALARRMPHEISGGQQQRVALARALAPGPGIVLLDEPFSALDEHLRARIRHDVIDIIRRSKAAAIIVTHDRREAFSSGDRVGLINHGRLVQIDTPRNIYQRPLTPEIARFVSDQSLLLPACFSSNGCCAECCLANRIPVEVQPHLDRQASDGENGYLLIRADQLVTTAPDQAGALFSASVEHVEFHGDHSKLQLMSGGVPISLTIPNDSAMVHVGQTVGLKLMGKGIFYTHDGAEVTQMPTGTPAIGWHSVRSGTEG